MNTRQNIMLMKNHHYIPPPKKKAINKFNIKTITMKTKNLVLKNTAHVARMQTFTPCCFLR